MAVLAEFINVIVPVATLERRFPGGLAAYQETVPNRTFCQDGALTRVGFMSPAQVGAWIDFLQRQGLVFLRGDHCVDIAVVDQLRGFTMPCDWVVFVQSFQDDMSLVASPHEGPDDFDVVMPAGWSPVPHAEQFFVPNDEIADRVEVLGERDGLLEVRDRKTGRTGFLPREALVSTRSRGADGVRQH